MKGLWNLFKITIIIIAITCNLRIKKRFLPVYKVPSSVPKPTPTTYNKSFEWSPNWFLFFIDYLMFEIDKTSNQMQLHFTFETCPLFSSQHTFRDT